MYGLRVTSVPWDLPRHDKTQKRLHVMAMQKVLVKSCHLKVVSASLGGGRVEVVWPPGLGVQDRKRLVSGDLLRYAQCDLQCPKEIR